MKRLFIAGSCGLFLFAGTAAARAQSTVDFTRCTTANLLGGVAFSEGDQTAQFGGAVGWELAPRFAVETTARWLVPKNGADAFAVSFTAQTALLSRRTFVPFVSGGLGAVQRELRRKRQPRPRVLQPPHGRTRRAGRSDERFTDPAVVFGGGVSIFATRNMSIRPEVETIWVRQDSMNHFVTSVSVRFAYHFESHRVTSSAKSTR